MGKTQSTGKSDIKWTDKATAIAAFVAIVLSIWSLIQSSESIRTAEESNDIAREALVNNATQEARQATPKIALSRYLAETPDMLSGEDAQWISRRKLIPLFIQSRFWLTEKSQYKDNSQKRYLFILIINHGPGRVEEASISNISWIPKEGQQVPLGLAPDSPLGILPSGAFYALLVDVLESPDLIDYSKSMHFESEKFELTVVYKDELGRETQVPIGWKTIPPLEEYAPP